MSTTTFFCTNIHNHLYCYFTISHFYIQIIFTPCYSHVTHQRLQFRQLKDYNFLNHFSQRFFLKSWPCHILAAAPQYFHSAWCYDYGKSILWDNRGGEAWVCWQNVINDVCLFFITQALKCMISWVQFGVTISDLGNTLPLVFESIHNPELFDTSVDLIVEVATHPSGMK